MFEWEEEYMVQETLKFVFHRKPISQRVGKTTSPKNKVRKFNEGVLSYEDIVGEDDNSIIQHAQSEGEFDVEVYEGENNMGGVRIWSIKLGDKFLPFTPELHEEEKVEK